MTKSLSSQPSTSSPSSDASHAPSNQQNQPPLTPSSPLTLARPLEDLGSVTYPAGISSPNPELNAGVKEGKFRYDRDFLLQFMFICKEKPDSLPPLDAIGLGQLSLIRGGSGRSRKLLVSCSAAPSRQAFIGGGPTNAIFQSMGQFTTLSGNFGPGSGRFEAAGARSLSTGGPSVPLRDPPLQHTTSQGGPGGSVPSHRTRSKRGEKRSATKVGDPSGPQSHGPTFGQPQGALPPFEPVVPLQATENTWERKLPASNDPPEVVDRKVKALLNKLTMEKFDSISDQIIQWANRSENQKGGRTLIQVIRLVFEKVTNDATCSEMYARLCRKMMEQISSKIQDEGVKSAKGNFIAGGELFRKYLLNRCHEDFERDWIAKEASAAAAASKAKDDQAIKYVHEQSGTGEVALYSEEYYTAQKAKRQGLRLIEFIGKLFKLHMLTKPIMHKCIEKLLGNMHNPEEDDIESLWKLMTTVGLLLDTRKGRAHNDMDVYFQRMKELSLNPNVSSRIQFMLQDVLELRERRWVACNPLAGSATLAQIHEAAARENAAQESKAAAQPQGRKLMHKPRTKLMEEPTLPAEESVTPSAGLSQMSEQAADAKITEDLKEFFNIRNLDEAEVYFSTLPPQYHHNLVNKLATKAVADARLVADLFTRAKTKGLCSPDAFEAGLTRTAEDIVIDVPKAWSLFANMVNGAGLDEEQRTRLASKWTDSDKLLGLLSS